MTPETDPRNAIHTDAFAGSWTARLLRQAPLILPTRQFMYPQLVPGEEDAMNRGALFVEVKPAVGGSFLATCALGFHEPTLPTGLWSCPAPDDLLAVAGGYAYLVHTAVPDTAEFLPLRPVCAVLTVPAEQLLLLAGFHTVLALGEEGILWQTARLSWEGIALGEVRDGTLHGTGWDMFSDRDLPFHVDLRTGNYEGGGYLVK